MARGGKRQPRSPAPVSNPGSGARTDGGAGSKSQPLRVANDQEYGARQAAVAQQSAAPMAAAGGSPAPGGGGPAPQGGPLPPLDVFGPSQRPNEPATAGLGQASLYAEDDPYLAIRIAYQQYPDPALGRLLPENQ